jgi:uncharacterized membrane protein SpoIIM required for sporulation
MAWIHRELAKIAVALRRARTWILALALVHVLAVIVAAIMVHAGYVPTIALRDRLVAQARQSDPVSLASRRGDNIQAALLEAARTEWVCVSVAVTGLTVVSPYVLAAYRGVVGGVVSVDDNHISRLLHPGQASYYISVIILQIIPYALAGGAGVKLGLAYFQRGSESEGGRWLGYPKEAIWDVVRILVLTIPFVLLANLWEFLSPLNR